MDLPGHDESKALIIKGLEIRKESNYRIRLYIKTLTRGEEREGDISKEEGGLVSHTEIGQRNGVHRWEGVVSLTHA